MGINASRYRPTRGFYNLESRWLPDVWEVVTEGIILFRKMEGLHVVVHQ